MREGSAQNLLSALNGERRVAIGLTAPEELRRLSDERRLTCPGCGACVVLHAGSVRIHHFAHLPGAVCRLPQTEPETEEHRAGKLLLAHWLRDRLPDAEVILEGFLPETGQRADLLLLLPEPQAAPRRAAIEYQCANLTAREWRRRHQLYASAGIADLWLLGGSRFHREPDAGDGGAERSRAAMTLRTQELERALIWDGAPLLFLDAVGDRLPHGVLARFRPDAETQALRPTGRLSARPLLELDFPWTLLEWSLKMHPNTILPPSALRSGGERRTASAGDGAFYLWEWLAQRFRVTPSTLSPFFGLDLPGQEVLTCEARLWQAALYYRFVHGRVGDGWWLPEVESFARAYLPQSNPPRLPRLRLALAAYQEALAAAGLLSLPRGYARASARILADLTTLTAPPDPEETLKLARYRRTLLREAAAAYSVALI